MIPRYLTNSSMKDVFETDPRNVDVSIPYYRGIGEPRVSGWNKSPRKKPNVSRRDKTLQRRLPISLRLLPRDESPQRTPPILSRHRISQWYESPRRRAQVSRTNPRVLQRDESPQWRLPISSKYRVSPRDESPQRKPKNPHR